MFSRHAFRILVTVAVVVVLTVSAIQLHAQQSTEPSARRAHSDQTAIAPGGH